MRIRNQTIILYWKSFCHSPIARKSPSIRV